MRKLLFIAVLTGILPALRGAEPKWIRMPSADFEIYSSAGEGDTRRALQYFERVRSFFEQSLGGGAQQKREPVRVIIFGSKKGLRSTGLTISRRLIIIKSPGAIILCWGVSTMKFSRLRCMNMCIWWCAMRG